MEIGDAGRIKAHVGHAWLCHGLGQRDSTTRQLAIVLNVQEHMGRAAAICDEDGSLVSGLLGFTCVLVEVPA
jgi:hypothetical protein